MKKKTIILPGGSFIGELDVKGNGQGTFTGTDGSKYVGEYKDNKPHGQGTFTGTDGSKYVGEFKDYQQHGQGTHTFANGDKRVGGWKDGKQHGQGTVTRADGNKYVGEWKDGKFHGQGTFTFPKPGSYAIKSGKFDGNKYKYVGIIFQQKYVGEFKDDKKNGRGTQTDHIGNIYVGQFKNGLKHGQGTHTFANGHKYVGEWKDGEYHGQGTFIWKDGRVDKHIWENGVIMETIELAKKYDSLLDRINLVKEKIFNSQQNIILKSSSRKETDIKKLIPPAAGLQNLLRLMDGITEFALKKRSTDTFTLDVYEQQSKNIDEIERQLRQLDL